ncbi:hypothetical protein ES708_17988 [subsurface metagenome]
MQKNLLRKETGMKKGFVIAVFAGLAFLLVFGGCNDDKDRSVSVFAYPEAAIDHSGFDFSLGAVGEYPTYDGETIGWQPGSVDNPDYPRDDYVWWRNTHLDTTDYKNQVKDMGAVDISTVLTAPSDTEWDVSPNITPLLVGHTYVAKCNDGYVKFQVISVDLTGNWAANVKYYYSTTSTFDR